MSNIAQEIQSSSRRCLGLDFFIEVLHWWASTGLGCDSITFRSSSRLVTNFCTPTTANFTTCSERFSSLRYSTPPFPKMIPTFSTLCPSIRCFYHNSRHATHSPHCHTLQPPCPYPEHRAFVSSSSPTY